MDSDESAEYEGWSSKARYIADRLKGLPGLRVVVEDTPVDRQGPQPVIYFERNWKGPSASRVRAALLESEPKIYVGGGAYRDEINIAMVNLQDGEEKIVAERLLQALGAG
jgi:hypothetical protein